MRDGVAYAEEARRQDEGRRRAAAGGSCRRLTAMGSGTDWNACTSVWRLPGRSVAVAEQRTDTTCKRQGDGSIQKSTHAQ